MAWLTTLDSAKRIVRARRKEKLFSFVQSGSLTPGSSTGGLTFTQTVVGVRTISTFEYPGISQAVGEGLADSLDGNESTVEARFEYVDAGMGSVWWTTSVDEYT